MRTLPRASHATSTSPREPTAPTRRARARWRAGSASRSRGPRGAARRRRGRWSSPRSSNHASARSPRALPASDGGAIRGCSTTRRDGPKRPPERIATRSSERGSRFDPTGRTIATAAARAEERPDRRLRPAGAPASPSSERQPISPPPAHRPSTNMWGPETSRGADHGGAASVEAGRTTRTARASSTRRMPTLQRAATAKSCSEPPRRGSLRTGGRARAGPPAGRPPAARRARPAPPAVAPRAPAARARRPPTPAGARAAPA